jgi:hypothetical protein
MIRRPFWLVTGAALGAGGTVWARRRLDRLARRVRPTAVAGELVSLADRTRRGAADKVRDALDTGRTEAQRREDDLWRDLGDRDRVPR